MNNEIKEILDDLLFTTTLPNVSIKLSEEKLYQLKDYITNLQKENDRHFKEAIRYENACDELEIRIDKAIKYVTDYSKVLDERTIVNILQGEDKDE